MPRAANFLEVLILTHFQEASFSKWIHFLSFHLNWQNFQTILFAQFLSQTPFSLIFQHNIYILIIFSQKIAHSIVHTTQNTVISVTGKTIARAWLYSESFYHQFVSNNYCGYFNTYNTSQVSPDVKLKWNVHKESEWYKSKRRN